MNVLKGTAILISLLFQVFCIIYYMIIGCRFQTELMLILTAFQIVTVIITTKRTFTDKLFSKKIEDYTFSRRRVGWIKAETRWMKRESKTLRVV